MSSSNTLALAAPLPPGRYLVQLAAPNDPPPSGRYAVERVARRNVDEHVQAEFAVCAHIDLLDRDLREGDRVHVLRRSKGTVRSLIRRVAIKRGTVLLRPLEATSGGQPKLIDATTVAVMGLVTGTYKQFRV